MSTPPSPDDLVYPVGTDLIRDGDDAISNNAAVLLALIADPAATLLTSSSGHVDTLTTPGPYIVHAAGVAASLGFPEAIASRLQVARLGSSVIQVVITGNLSGNRGVRTYTRYKGTTWSAWRGDAGNRPGASALFALDDTANAAGHVIEIDHRGDGSGDASGQTYGIDVQNFPGARQAIVVHQYSDAREAVRIDNTDSNASVYINNTANENINPGNTGAGAAFFKFRPYHPTNFTNFAYLTDDLTWLNDKTGKIWSFRSLTASEPIVQFKNAAGTVVAQVNQNGTYTGTGTGWKALPLVSGVTGGAFIYRDGGMVTLLLSNTTVPTGGTQNLVAIPVGYRPAQLAGVSWRNGVLMDFAGTTTRWAGYQDGFMRILNGSAGVTFNGTMSWPTTDPPPATP